ncbi:alkaline phosphatase family protein [Actinomadura parmotrematis]|uniref:phospholipase C n=1 Tax=Actinomadura parmotrematis TaxID=2864039 RepID=A0ABS7G3Y0_9ACTN|nr:alkaline phosphatase family protein [Actinomadura parmotrematis]MBW8487181.1 alkaline phosphatase family protein [Actinomadura parmotrematis]
MPASPLSPSARRRSVLLALVAVLTAAAVAAAVAVTGRRPAYAAGVPALDHVVVVVLENHAYSQVIGSSSAPYINSLAAGGANLTAFYAETHPSQPNYFALFSGSTQGVTDDTCAPPGAPYSTANLGAELIAAGRTWGSYNEGLPSAGSTTCSNSAGKYARKHNPWFSFSNVPASTGYTWAQWPTDYTRLPTVSFAVPNLCNDMHDCSVGTGDTWVKSKLSAYATWAVAHNSALVVTFDEDNRLAGNRIPTVVYGAHVKTGTYATQWNHYNLLRTLEDMYGTTHAGNAASASPITAIWQ